MDGSRIVSAAVDGTIRQWDAQTGDELLRIHNFANERATSWGAIEYPNDPARAKLISHGPQAWRFFGRLVRNAEGQPEMWPVDLP